MKFRYIPIAALVLLATAFAFNRAYWAYQVSVERDKLRALGYPATKEEFAEWYALPDGEANSAELYAKAIEAYSDEGIDGSLLAYVHRSELAHGAPWPREILVETGKWIELNAKTLKLLHDASKCDYSRGAIDFEKATWLLEPELGAIATHDSHFGVSHLIGDAIAYYGGVENREQLFVSLETALGLARAQPEDYYVLQLIAGWSGDEYFLSQIAGLLENAKLTDEELKRIDRLLESEMSRRNADLYVLSSICMPFLSRNPPKHILSLDWLSNAFERELYTGELVSASIRDLRDLLLFAQWYFEDPSVLDPERRFSPPPPELIARMRPWMSMVHYAQLELDDVRRLVTRYKLTRIAIAMERHRIATGSWPTGLADIQSTLLTVSNIDPYSGSKLVLVLQDENYWIYSVGPNGKDDGGYNPVTDRELGDDIAVAVIRTLPADELVSREDSLQ